MTGTDLLDEKDGEELQVSTHLASPPCQSGQGEGQQEQEEARENTGQEHVSLVHSILHVASTSSTSRAESNGGYRKLAPLFALIIILAAERCSAHVKIKPELHGAQEMDASPCTCVGCSHLDDLHSARSRLVRLKVDDADVISTFPPYAAPSPPSCPTKPNRRPYMGFTELLARDNDEPDRSHRRPSFSRQALNLTDKEGRHIHLIYTAHHHDAPVLGLDHEEECIASVACVDLSAVIVSFCTAVDASTAVVDFQSGGLVTGGAHWGCSDNINESPNIILRKTLSVHKDPGDSRTVIFRTSAAEYTDFFQSAKIRFGTNMFYPAHETVHDNFASQHAESDIAEGDVETSTQFDAKMRSTIGLKERTTGFSSWLAKSWTEVKQIVRSSLANACSRVTRLDEPTKCVLSNA
eukprot:COSAG02_NODE_2115_length_9799_cov_10.795052_2_plen_409_part_00